MPDVIFFPIFGLFVIAILTVLFVPSFRSRNMLRAFGKKRGIPVVKNPDNVQLPHVFDPSPERPRFTHVRNLIVMSPDILIFTNTQVVGEPAHSGRNEFQTHLCFLLKTHSVSGSHVALLDPVPGSRKLYEAVVNSVVSHTPYIKLPGFDHYSFTSTDEEELKSVVAKINDQLLQIDGLLSKKFIGRSSLDSRPGIMKMEVKEEYALIRFDINYAKYIDALYPIVEQIGARLLA